VTGGPARGPPRVHSAAVRDPVGHRAARIEGKRDAGDVPRVVRRQLQDGVGDGDRLDEGRRQRVQRPEPGLAPSASSAPSNPQNAGSARSACRPSSGAPSWPDPVRRELDRRRSRRRARWSAAGSAATRW
jgi:hypothetical protein